MRKRQGLLIIMDGLGDRPDPVLGGMTPLDAVMHMFTTVSLGGLSSHDSSLGFYNSPVIEGITLAFMLMASCNFALYFVVQCLQRSG